MSSLGSIFNFMQATNIQNTTNSLTSLSLSPSQQTKKTKQHQLQFEELKIKNFQTLISTPIDEKIPQEELVLFAKLQEELIAEVREKNIDADIVSNFFEVLENPDKVTYIYDAARSLTSGSIEERALLRKVSTYISGEIRKHYILSSGYYEECIESAWLYETERALEALFPDFFAKVEKVAPLMLKALSAKQVVFDEAHGLLHKHITQLEEFSKEELQLFYDCTLKEKNDRFFTKKYEIFLANMKEFFSNSYMVADLDIKLLLKGFFRSILLVQERLETGKIIYGFDIQPLVARVQSQQSE